MPKVGRLFAGASHLRPMFARDSSASTAVEFALVAPIVIALALATLQAGTVFLMKAFFELAAEAAARVVMTNQTVSLSAAQFQTQVCAELTALFNCSNVIVQLTPLPAGATNSNLASYLPQFNANGTLVANPTVDVGANAGASGTDMMLVFMYEWPVYGGPLGFNLATFSNGTLLMSSTQIFRVEPQ